MKEMKKTMIRYIREDGEHTGICVVGVTDGITIGIGWSVCSDYDHFNKKLGRTIAVGRARKALVENMPVGPIMQDAKWRNKIHHLCMHILDVLSKSKE